MDVFEEVRETENLEIEKPETVTKIIAPTDNLTTSAAASHKQYRRPPPLLLIPRTNVSGTGSSVGFTEKSFEYQEESNNGKRSLSEMLEIEVDSSTNQEKEGNRKCNISICSSFEGDETVPEQEQDMDGLLPNNEFETSAHKLDTATHETQKEQKLIKSKCRIQAVNRSNVRVVNGRNPLNKRLLVKIFETVKAIKKDHGEMKNALTHIKRNQIILRNKLKELLYCQKPKQTIEFDRSFIVPKMPIKRVSAVEELEEDCLEDDYSDQLAVRFQKFTATDTNDVKPAVKRIMEHIFSVGLLLKYSWSGKSELNSKLSVAVPVANSLSFVFTAISALLLGEQRASLKNYIGMALVMLGTTICMVAKISNETTQTQTS